MTWRPSRGSCRRTGRGLRPPRRKRAAAPGYSPGAAVVRSRLLLPTDVEAVLRLGVTTPREVEHELQRLVAERRRHHAPEAVVTGETVLRLQQLRGLARLVVEDLEVAVLRQRVADIRPVTGLVVVAVGVDARLTDRDDLLDARHRLVGVRRTSGERLRQQQRSAGEDGETEKLDPTGPKGGPKSRHMTPPCRTVRCRWSSHRSPPGYAAG